MASTRIGSTLLLSLVVLNVAFARQLQQDSSPAPEASATCPLSADDVQLDFSSLSASCGSPDTVCSTCFCSVLETLTPAYVAGGVTYDPTNSSSLDSALLGSITEGCLTQYAPQLASALSSDATNLVQLAQCPFLSSSDPANVPACVQEFVATLPLPDTVSADNSSLNDIDTTLQTLDIELDDTISIATIGRPSGNSGPLFINVTGNFTGNTTADLNSLLEAMASDLDLFSLMTENETALYDRVSANATLIAANPETDAVLGNLTNPVDAVALLTRLSLLADGATVIATDDMTIRESDNSTDTIVLPGTTTVASPVFSPPAVLASPAPPTSGAVAVGLKGAFVALAGLFAMLL